MRLSVQLDVYTRDQLLRGELLDFSGRTLDYLNNPLERSLTLQNARVGSLRSSDEPVGIISTVCLEKSSILVAVPREPPGLRRHLQLSALPVRRPARLTVAIGPYVLTGKLWQSATETQPLEALWRSDTANRPFLPMTEAIIATADAPEHGISVATAFLARGELTWAALAPAASAAAAPAVAPRSPYGRATG